MASCESVSGGLFVSADDVDTIDCASQGVLDALTSAAATLCDVPMAVISTVRDHRLSFRARTGFQESSGVPVEQSFCQYTMASEAFFEIPDTRLDSRSRDHAVVTGASKIRFYAGVPLLLGDQTCLGTLCVMDQRPRQLEREQRIALGNLAKAIVQLFESNAHQADQQEIIALAHEKMQIATDSGNIGVWEWDLVNDTLEWTEPMYALFGLACYEKTASYELVMDLVHPDDREKLSRALRESVEGYGNLDTEFRIVWQDGSVHHLRATAHILRDYRGSATKMVGINWDLTELREVGNELAEQKELLQVTLTSIGDAVITTDETGQVTWLNPAAETMTGWPLDDAVGEPLTQVFNIINSESRQRASDPVAACLKHQAVVGLAADTVLLARDGCEVGIEDSAAPIRDGSGRILGVVLVFHDVTEKRRLSSEMNYRATHDLLTGLANRGEFDTQLASLLSLAQEDQRASAALYVDLDQFKLVNDACGHSIGDRLLCEVASLLRSCVREGDLLARLGGDEFGLLLRNCTAEQAVRVGETICERMEHFRFEHQGRKFRIGTSIGLVPVDDRWSNTSAILQAADSACYAAKEAGRNRVHRWFDSDEATSGRRKDMQWTSRLEQALDEDRFALYFQRIEAVDRNDRGIYAEVLVRLIDEDGELVPPSAFLPAAERFNLATRIDRWVLKQSLERLQSLPNMAAIKTLSINVSGQSVGDRAFHQDVIELLQGASADLCRRICIEITETAAVTRLADAQNFIGRLRELGVRVALDDFGAGASSFSYIKQLPVDVLKIDGQFIQNMMDDALDDAAVRCFVDVARLMKLKTVAEYVDRPAILKRVRDLGIDYAQGYLLHRPEPIDGRISECQRWSMTG